jgi:hypothetical protein
MLFKRTFPFAGIVPLQSGTNKLASQAGMTGMGMPRIIDGK